jgi:hypothetical protein
MKKTSMPKYNNIILITLFILCCVLLIFGAYQEVTKGQDAYFMITILFLPALGKNIKFPKWMWIVVSLMGLAVIFYYVWVVYLLNSENPAKDMQVYSLNTSQVR